MKSNNFVFPIRVYIEDTDFGGVVFHANYLKYFERGRSEMAYAAGFGIEWQRKAGVFFLIRHAHIDYLKPARLWDQLEVVTSVKTVKKASFVYDQHLRFASAPDSILCKADIRIACVDQSIQPCALPDDFERFLEGGLVV